MNKSSSTTISARDRLILALDTQSLEQAKRLVDELRDFIGVFKVGLELFCSAGFAVLDYLQAEKVPVFFDGKFLDIPNTVAKASQAMAKRGVFMFNVHATGGSQMLKATAETTRETCRQAGVAAPKVIAVTILTSIGSDVLSGELGVRHDLESQVVNLAKLTQECGLDGVVASAAEAALIRKACGPDFLIVTPGVRPAWSAKDDQVRIVTPSQALQNGSDYLVVGRPITAAENRRDAARRVLEELESIN